MPVRRLEQFPGAISRSAWEVGIDGKKLGDWAMASYEIRAEDGIIEVMIAVPFAIEGAYAQFINLMNPERGYELMLACFHAVEDKTKVPTLIVRDAHPKKYELLPMDLQGTRLAGLDARSDMPVVQAITFHARLAAQKMGLENDTEE